MLELLELKRRLESTGGEEVDISQWAKDFYGGVVWAKIGGVPNNPRNRLRLSYKVSDGLGQKVSVVYTDSIASAFLSLGKDLGARKSELETKH